METNKNQNLESIVNGVRVKRDNALEEYKQATFTTVEHKNELAAKIAIWQALEVGIRIGSGEINGGEIDISLAKRIKVHIPGDWPLYFYELILQDTKLGLLIETHVPLMGGQNV